jgi:hypothetical protein|tara:strand:- start:165 stop:380 length:216 start_codon:yes stop_codon:yes gene_type:complete
MSNEITAGQEIAWISAKHSRMVGSVLDQLEAALPEGAQCDKLKKLVQVPLYNFRQEVYELITGKVDLSLSE